MDYISIKEENATFGPDYDTALLNKWGGSERLFDEKVKDEQRKVSRVSRLYVGSL